MKSKEFYIKLVNATTNIKCPICNEKAEQVTDEKSDVVVVIFHKSECIYSNLNDNKYTRYPITKMR